MEPENKKSSLKYREIRNNHLITFQLILSLLSLSTSDIQLSSSSSIFSLNMKIRKLEKLVGSSQIYKAYLKKSLCHT